MLTGRILAARAPADGHGAPQVRRWHLCTVATDNSGHRLPDEGLPSGCVLHVSGLPWHTPVPVACASLSHFCEDFGISAPVAIHVRPVSDSTSARDQGKQHLGSARLVFPDPAAAAAALRALQTTPPPPGFPASLRAQYHVPPAPPPAPPAPRPLADPAVRAARRATRLRRRARHVTQLRTLLAGLALPGGPDGAAGAGPGDAGAEDEAGWWGRRRAACYSALRPAEVATGLVDWAAMPAPLHPGEGGGLGNKGKGLYLRTQRKLWQVESFVAFLSLLRLPAGSRVVDFGSGSGNLTLPLAWRFPELQFVAVDLKAEAVRLLEQRASLAKMTNVTAWHGSVEEYPGAFDCALALHLCGAASDLAIVSAAERNAAYIMVPCCLGKLRFTMEHNDAMAEAAANPSGVAAEAEECRGTADDNVDRRTARLGRVAYPRSAWLAAQLAGAGAGADVGPALAAAADWSEGRTAVEGLPWRRFSKTVVELDRNQWAVERHGYQTWLLRLLQEQGSPKNDVLLGVPRDFAHMGELLTAFRNPPAEAAHCEAPQSTA